MLIFYVKGERFSTSKDDVNITFNDVLIRLRDKAKLGIDMSDFIHPETNITRDRYFYELVATIKNDRSVSSGHYTAVCKRPVKCDGQKPSRWFRFDDFKANQIDNASPINPKTIAFIFQLDENESFERNDRFKSLGPFFTQRYKSEPFEAFLRALGSYKKSKSIEIKFQESGNLKRTFMQMNNPEKLIKAREKVKKAALTFFESVQHNTVYKEYL